MWIHIWNSFFRENVWWWAELNKTVFWKACLFVLKNIQIFSQLEELLPLLKLFLKINIELELFFRENMRWRASINSFFWKLDLVICTQKNCSWRKKKIQDVFSSMYKIILSQALQKQVDWAVLATTF